MQRFFGHVFERLFFPFRRHLFSFVCFFSAFSRFFRGALSSVRFRGNFEVFMGENEVGRKISGPFPKLELAEQVGR